MDDRCKCSVRGQLIGDGCQYCNPQLTIEILQERVDELERAFVKLSSILDEV